MGPTSSTRIWIDDVNTDGKLDILVGDKTILTSPAEGITEEEYKRRLETWTKQVEEANEKLMALRVRGSTSDEDTEAEPSGRPGWLQSLLGPGGSKSELVQAQEHLSALYKEQSDFLHRESTGFVWLYLQK